MPDPPRGMDIIPPPGQGLPEYTTFRLGWQGPASSARSCLERPPRYHLVVKGIALYNGRRIKNARPGRVEGEQRIPRSDVTHYKVVVNPVAVLETVFLYYSVPLTAFERDGQTITQPLLWIPVMNAPRMGGGPMMAPQVQPDHSLIDLRIAREVSHTRISGLIPHSVRGAKVTQRPIQMGRGSRRHRPEFELLVAQIAVISAAGGRRPMLVEEEVK